MKYRKKPVVIDAIQFTGDNLKEVQAFATVNPPSFFQEIDPLDRSDDPEQVAQIWDKLHGTWVGVYKGNWIIRGIKGEFYPCDERVFAETYDEVPGQKVETPLPNQLDIEKELEKKDDRTNR